MTPPSGVLRLWFLILKGFSSYPKFFAFSVPFRAQFKGRTEKSIVILDSDYLREALAPPTPWLLQLTDTCLEYRAPLGDTEETFPLRKSHLPAWQMPTRHSSPLSLFWIILQSLPYSVPYWAWEFAFSTCQEMSSVSRSPWLYTLVFRQKRNSKDSRNGSRPLTNFSSGMF